MLPSLLAGLAGYDTPRAVFPSIVDVRGDSTGAIIGQDDMPVVVPSGAFGQTAQKTVDFPQLPFFASRRHPGRGAEADFHDLTCSEDHRDSAVQFVFWWSMPLLCRSCLLCPLLSRQARMVQTLQKFVEVPQSQFLPVVGRPCAHAATLGLATLKVPQIQFIAGVSGHFSRHKDRNGQLQLCMVGMVSAMRGSLLKFCSIFGLRPAGRRVPRVAGTPGV